MALVPYNTSDLDLLDYRRRLWNDWDLWDYDVPSSWSRLARLRASCPDLSRCFVGKDGFEANVDLHQFKSYEITVKTVGDTIIIEGKHEKRRDGDSIVGRHVVKRYTLPRGYDSKDVTSTLSSDGILTVKARPPLNIERNVYVRQTGPSYLSIKG